MLQILDLIRLEESVELVILIVLLIFVGGQMAMPNQETHRRARHISAVSFLLYAGTGIYAWGVSSASDLLIIVIRAMLAAGVTFGTALVTVVPLFACVHLAKVRYVPRRHPETAVCRQLVQQESSSQRETMNECDSTEQADKVRKSKIDDVRSEVTRYYDEHKTLIEETWPPALFRTQIQARFPESATPEQALSAAQELISKMLEKIAEARERERIKQEEHKKQEAQTTEDQRKQQEANDRMNAVDRLTDWYQREKSLLEQRLTGRDLEDSLRLLFERYDRLLKEALQEIRI